MDKDSQKQLYFLADPGSDTKILLKDSWTIDSVNFNIIVSNCVYDNMDHMQIVVSYRKLVLKSTSYDLKLFHRSMSNHKWELVHNRMHRMNTSTRSYTFKLPYTRIFQHCPISKLCLIEVSTSFSTEKAANLVNECKFFEKQWNERLYTDFVFQVKNFKFPVHKNILAYQSDVFKQMFDDEPNMTTITDISPVAFNQFLEYLYIKKCPSFSDFTIDLYKAAHKFGIVELMNLCKNNIALNVCAKNAMEVLEFANVYHIDEIRITAFEIVQKELFPEKQLPSNFQYNMELMKELIATKFAYESLLSNIIDQGSNKNID